MKKLFLVVITLISLSSNNAFALTKFERSRVADAQKFLDNLKTLQGGFIQLESKNSRLVRGEVYISKPGKMLMRYTDPQQADFYLVGGRLMVYDYEMEQLNHTDADDTAFSIFLKPDFNLESNLMLKVKAVEEDSDKYTIRFEPLNPNDVETKEISLEFNSNTNELMGFERLNSDDDRFIITFVNIKLNKPLNEEIFVFKDPRKLQKYPATGRR